MSTAWIHHMGRDVHLFCSAHRCIWYVRGYILRILFSPPNFITRDITGTTGVIAPPGCKVRIGGRRGAWLTACTRLVIYPNYQDFAASASVLCISTPPAALLVNPCSFTPRMQDLACVPSPGPSSNLLSTSSGLLHWTLRPVSS